jgi:hypothetical protein
MNKKLYALYAVAFSLAMLACSNDNVTGSSEDPNVLTAKNDSSSSSLDGETSSSTVRLEMSSSSSLLVRENSSSSEPLVLCKASGDWGSYGCHITLPSGEGDLWSTGDLKVKTSAYVKDSSKFGNRAGELFFEKDSVDKRHAEIRWAYGESSHEFTGALDAFILLDSTYNSFVNVGFYVAGIDSNGEVLSADISNWNGICVLYNGSITPSLQLDLGDSINQKMGNALPSVALESKKEPQCFEWKEFKPSATNNENVIVSDEDVSKHVEKIVFHFQIQPHEDFHGYESFTILAIGTNRDD